MLTLRDILYNISVTTKIRLQSQSLSYDYQNRFYSVGELLELPENIDMIRIIMISAVEHDMVIIYAELL